MAANEKNSGGIVNWFDTRFPVTDLLEKDQILKEIDALNQIADDANTRAEGIIKELEEIRRKG